MSLIFFIIIAFIFDILNGFHDAANSIATVVSTQVLRPKTAVLWAAFFNLIAVVIFAPHVANTISQIVRIEPGDAVYLYVIFAGLMGGILWDLFTWVLGLPTSSSHALIGGLSGAALAYAGMGALRFDIIAITAAFIFISPLIGFIGGFLIMLLNTYLAKNKPPYEIDRFYRRSQLVSAALYSIGHGANDAQKTMGVIFAMLLASGHLDASTKLSLFNPKTAWIILSCNLCMALGTAFGGWRIVKTMGMKIARIKPIGGFSAETAGALTLYFATFLGVPVSTTHVITSSILGSAMVLEPLSKINWTSTYRIIWAWIFTLPGSALIGALTYLFIRPFV